MSTETNTKFSGYCTWYAGSSDSYVNGAWLDLQLGAGAVSRRIGNTYYKSGKVYFEINVRGNVDVDVKYRLGVTNKTIQESPTNDLFGSSDQDWVLDTRDSNYYHDNSSSTAGSGLSGIAYGVFANPLSCGVYYSTTFDILRKYAVFRVAIDFAAGKIWFGVGYPGGVQSWDGGDPEAGTSPNFTFSANLPLTPCASVINTNDSYDQRGILQLLTTRDTCWCSIPSGFSYLDDNGAIYQESVLEQTPNGYWFATPFSPDDGQILNNMGVPVRVIDSSGNENYAQYYNLVHYINASKAIHSFSTLPKWMYQQVAYNGMNSFPCSLSSSSSFSVEALVYINGPGRADIGDTSYKGGSFLVCRDVLASQYGTISESDLWFGLVLRDRRLVFGVGSYEAATSTDIDDGVYYLVGELDIANTAIRLYINTVLAAEITDYVSPSQSCQYINIGSRRPYKTSGQFPGYFRNIAIYDSVLTSNQKTEHYESLTQDYTLAERVVVARDPRALMNPTHIL